MNWRGSQQASRNRYLLKYDAEEVERYESWTLQRTREDEDATLSDIARAFQFRVGMSILDAGTGSGALCKTLSYVPGLTLTALDPSPAMLAKLREKAELRDVKIVEGFCDGEGDRSLFDRSAFDVIASQQLANGLFDPLAAFANWFFWLKPGGSVLLIDGLFDRAVWTDRWEEEIDILPLSACRTISTTPYLLERVGFRIESVGFMTATNERAPTRAPRYLVVASKPIALNQNE